MLQLMAHGNCGLIIWAIWLFLALTRDVLSHFWAKTISVKSSMMKTMLYARLYLSKVHGDDICIICVHPNIVEKLFAIFLLIGTFVHIIWRDMIIGDRSTLIQLICCVAFSNKPIPVSALIQKNQFNIPSHTLLAWVLRLRHLSAYTEMCFSTSVELGPVSI